MRPSRAASVGVRSPLPQNLAPRPQPSLGHLILWERPWPRRGRCGPPAPIQSAVGVRRPLPQDPDPGSGRRSGALTCGSGLGRDTAFAGRRLRFTPAVSRRDFRETAPRRRHCGSGASAAGCARSPCRSAFRPAVGRTPSARRDRFRRGSGDRRPVSC